MLYKHNMRVLDVRKICDDVQKLLVAEGKTEAVDAQVRELSEFLAYYLQINDFKLHGHSLDVFSDTIVELQKFSETMLTAHDAATAWNEIIADLQDHSKFASVYLTSCGFTMFSTPFDHKKTSKNLARQISYEASISTRPTQIWLCYPEHEQTGRTAAFIVNYINQAISPITRKPVIRKRVDNELASNDPYHMKNWLMKQSSLSNDKDKAEDVLHIVVGLCAPQAITAFVQTAMCVPQKDLKKDNVVRHHIGSFNFFKHFVRA